MNKLQHLQYLGRLGNQGKVAITDSDARTYISAVETADNQSLEFGVKVAIQNFIVGAKADGIWDAIKSSCILAGARTLSGALVPLKGTAPTNFNFVSGDYNRKTGLVGDGSTKYLNSNRNNNADPQDAQHLSVYISSQSTGAANCNFIAAGDFVTAGSSSLQTGTNNTNMFVRSRNSLGTTYTAKVNGFFGKSRNASTFFSYRFSSSTATTSSTSQTPVNDNVFVFRGNTSTPAFANARLAFYSIGESLDLALLDARVTTLINSLASAIDGVTDSDARAYISAVEAADGEMLEFPVAQAIQAFIVGCKADGIWDAIKSSAILAGARTLSGALVPLKGTAPTNFNFVSGDYNRKTGLVGNGTTKYLNSNRANNADPQDSQHLSAWKATIHDTTVAGTFGGIIGAGGTLAGASQIARAGGITAGLNEAARSRSSTVNTSLGPEPPATGFVGLSRAAAGAYIYRTASVSTNITGSSAVPTSDLIFVFARNNGLGTPEGFLISRLAFYSIGESLNLALLDARVTQLITDLNNAIP